MQLKNGFIGLISESCPGFHHFSIGWKHDSQNMINCEARLFPHLHSNCYHLCTQEWFPFLKTTIWDFLVFKLNFHIWQYTNNLLIWDCRPSGVSEKITTSSAHNNNRIFTSNIDTPTPCPAKWFSRSFTYIENKNGDRHCLTPNLHVNVSDFSLLLNTLVITWLYIKRMMSIVFPRTPKFDSLYHKL